MTNFALNWWRSGIGLNHLLGLIIKPSQEGIFLTLFLIKLFFHLIYHLFTFVKLPADNLHLFLNLPYLSFVLNGNIFDLFNEHTKAFKHALRLMTLKDL